MGAAESSASKGGSAGRSSGFPCTDGVADTPRPTTITRASGDRDGVAGALRAMNETQRSTVQRADEWMHVLSDQLGFLKAELADVKTEQAAARAREVRLAAAMDERLEEVGAETREAAASAAKGVLVQAAGGLGVHTNGHARYNPPKSTVSLAKALAPPPAAAPAGAGIPSLSIEPGKAPTIPKERPLTNGPRVRRRADGKKGGSAESDVCIGGDLAEEEMDEAALEATLQDLKKRVAGVAVLSVLTIPSVPATLTMLTMTYYTYCTYR